jgi:hypothetical protein
MEPPTTARVVRDNGGRRRLRDRRYLLSVPFSGERRTQWERRSGYDRRLRRVFDYADERRVTDDPPSDEP